ncbi:MAG: NAD(P)H-dependent oxidoreductase [Pseudomonadales bacterium]|nr:NAD(P)H-dependent oxidoreductase [Pseudomonadales bacterium]
MQKTILTISGSLRKNSTHTQFLQAFSQLSTDTVKVNLYQALEQLPAFNPDNEQNLNPVTSRWIQLVREADAIVIASPEYAHGIPGVLKNALDWLVSTDAFIEKPFALFSACPRPMHAPAALEEVLSTMSGKAVRECFLSINLHRDSNTAAYTLAEKTAQFQLKMALDNLCLFLDNS